MDISGNEGNFTTNIRQYMASASKMLITSSPFPPFPELKVFIHSRAANAGSLGVIDAMYLLLPSAAAEEQAPPRTGLISCAYSLIGGEKKKEKESKFRS